jgi:TPR repeat protein
VKPFLLIIIILSLLLILITAVYVWRHSYDSLLAGVRVEHTPTDIAPLLCIFAPEPPAGSLNYSGITQHALSVQQNDSSAANAAAVCAAYELGIAHGESLAMFLMGDVYRKGYGYKKDATQALRWYKKAQHFGNRDGQYMHGYMIAHNQGVSYDGYKVYSLVKGAAAQGHALSQVWYAEMLAKMGRDPEAEAQLRKAAEAGNVVAQIRYAKRLVETTLKDVESAYRSLKLAVDAVELGVGGRIRDEFKSVVARIHQLAMMQMDKNVQKRWSDYVVDLGYDGKHWTRDWETRNR